MHKIYLTRVDLGELEQLQKISRHTFAEAFSAGTTAENMAEYLAEAFSIEKLKVELSRQSSEFYFARLNDRVIGYLKVNTGPAPTALKGDKALEIERIYVLKEFHGKSVGQQLYEKALQLAEQAGALYVWLGVWEENQRAISFYRKNGFVTFSKHLFSLGNDVQTDLLMKRQLNHARKGTNSSHSASR